MAKTRTLAQLRSAIRARGEYNSPLFSDADLTVFINESKAALYDIVLTHDDSHYRTTATINIVSGTGAYTLPSDFYYLKYVEVTDSSSRSGYRSLDRFNSEARNDFSAGVGDKAALAYDIQGGYLYLNPIPGYTESNGARVWYVPVSSDLSNDSDELDTINLWSEWIVLDVCEKCATKEGDTDQVNVFMRQKSAVEKRIIGGLTGRDRGRPAQVLNLRDRQEREFWYRSGYRIRGGG